LRVKRKPQGESAAKKKAKVTLLLKKREGGGEDSFAVPPTNPLFFGGRRGRSPRASRSWPPRRSAENVLVVVVFSKGKINSEKFQKKTLEKKDELYFNS